MATACLIIFNRWSGKLKKSYESEVPSALKLMLLDGKLTARQDAMIFDKSTGKVLVYAEGVKAGEMPKMYDKNLGNAEEYCPGILEKFKEE